MNVRGRVVRYVWRDNIQCTAWRNLNTANGEIPIRRLFDLKLKLRASSRMHNAISNLLQVPSERQFSERHEEIEHTCMVKDIPIAKVISRSVLEMLPRGKYTRWAQHISIDTLESLLSAVNVFGKEYNEVKIATGKYPNPTFYAHYMDEGRMRKALEVIAAVQTGHYLPKDPMTGPFPAPRLAFTYEFLEQIGTRGLNEDWIVQLNERQFWELLWQVDEYADRANASSGPQDKEYPPPTFGLPNREETLMRDALRNMAAANCLPMTALRFK